MNTKMARILSMVLIIALAAGCYGKKSGGTQNLSDGHEPLTISTANGMDYRTFEILLHERYPEVQLDIISYTGSNATGYTQYQFEHNDICDIFSYSIFGSQEEQRNYLLDLSGYEFLSKYKTNDINQVTLEGAVYLVPISLTVLGLYYNKTMFAEYGWTPPTDFEELKALGKVIQAQGIDPVSAQFELPGNGFFDLFTMAKTGFLSTPAGYRWETGFQEGEATAEEGLAEAAASLQEMIDDGLLDAEDAGRNSTDTLNRFFDRKAAIYLNAGLIKRFSQNMDGTGDQYGILPFLGNGKDGNVLITKPRQYFGLSKTLGEAGNEQKLADALKVMELMATREGQLALTQGEKSFITSLKDDVIPTDSPFNEVEDLIRSGHTSTLAYAGYEPIVVPVGEKVRDWVAGRCTGADVLLFMDQAQSEALNGMLPTVAVASENFTQEETAWLVAEAFRQAAETDVGFVSLGGYHGGIENCSGVCGKLFAGSITQEIINVIVPYRHTETVCILTLSGKQLKNLLETGFVLVEDAESFPYVAAGINVVKNKDGSLGKITFSDGSELDESELYTAAIDKGGFWEEAEIIGEWNDTDLITADVVAEYFRSHSPLSPEEPSSK